jgi:hypothetical protein
MAYVRTFTVTVSGGKYFIDSVQQPTINIAEGGLYKFDLSDSSNSKTSILDFQQQHQTAHIQVATIYTTGVDTVRNTRKFWCLSSNSSSRRWRISSCT